jgi:hypothetical protein
VGEKRSVEVERLLHWAYRDELAKCDISSAEGVWDAIEQYGQRGGIDPGHGAAQRYPHFGLPHPDALKIESAVAALKDVALDWDASRDSIMGDAGALLSYRDVILVRSLPTAALVTMHARMGTRPDWESERPRPRPVMALRGPARPTVIGECYARDRYSEGSHCPVQWEPSAIEVAEVRADYIAWHHGLTLLAATLKLDAHIALPPAAPALPWSEPETARRKIYFVGDLPKGTLPLPLKPQRCTALAPLRRNPLPPRRRHREAKRSARND